MDDPNMLEIANHIARLTRVVEGVVRAQQLSRTVIPTIDGDRELGDLLADLDEAAGDVAGLREDQAALDERNGLDAEALERLREQGESTLDDIAQHGDELAEQDEQLFEQREFIEEVDVTATLAGSAAAEALAEAAEAAQVAASARSTADGKNARRRGVTEPDPPEGGWAQGDQWVRDNTEGVPVEILVWNGEGFVPDQILADELLVVDEAGVVRIGQGRVDATALAVDALDFTIARGMQVYGGYFEAPEMASSDRLGSGANVLSDPNFVSTVNTAWVASGHLGDAPVTQRDTIVWDQIWTMPNIVGGSGTFRNRGNASADLKLTPGVRKTGSLVFANYSWLNAATRTFSNPFTFRNQSTWSFNHGQFGGAADPSLMVSDALPGAGVARTTYLTNSATVPVSAGQRWNIRLQFSRLTGDEATLVSSASVQIINAATSAVIFEQPISRTEMQAGGINHWWDSTFTGNVKYRICTTYVAAGGGSKQSALAERPKMMRAPTSGSWANQTENGAVVGSWNGSESLQWPYRSRPLTHARDPALWSTGGAYSGRYQARAHFAWTVHSAVFAEVEPESGWRLTTDGGLELFNAMGGKTVNLDGADNFFSGRTSTAESGARWEMVGQSLTLYSAANQVIGRFAPNGPKLRISGDIEFQGDTDWATLFTASGWGDVLSYRRRMGEVILSGNLSSPSGFQDTSWPVLATLPPGFRPGAQVTMDIPTTAANIRRLVRVEPNGQITTYNTGATTFRWGFGHIRFLAEN